MPSSSHSYPLMLHIEHGRNLHLVSVFMGEVVSKKQTGKYLQTKTMLLEWHEIWLKKVCHITWNFVEQLCHIIWSFVGYLPILFLITCALRLYDFVYLLHDYQVLTFHYCCLHCQSVNIDLNEATLCRLLHANTSSFGAINDM